MHEGARAHPSQARHVVCETRAERLTLAPLPAYAPDGTPMEPLGKQVQKAATPRKDCPECTTLPRAVDRALRPVAHTPRAMTVRMARSWEKLGLCSMDI
jgi:hypothetical protein